MNWLYQKEEHCIRFFRTKWSSKFSVKYWLKHPQWNIKFRDGYMEINLGKLSIRVRSKH